MSRTEPGLSHFGDLAHFVYVTSWPFSAEGKPRLRRMSPRKAELLERDAEAIRIRPDYPASTRLDLAFDQKQARRWQIERPFKH